MKLNTRLLIYLTLGLLAVIALQATLLTFFFKNFQETEKLRQAIDSNKQDTHTIQSQLLLQGYTIKNLFLRGHSAEDFYYHMEEFYNIEREIYSTLESIKLSLPEDQDIQDSYDELNHAIRSGSQDYRAAIEAYTNTTVNPHLVADRYMSIESLIQDELKYFTSLIFDFQQTTIIQLNDSIQKGIYLLLSISVIGGLGILFVLFIYFRSQFIKPLESAIQTATAISQGEQHRRIKVASKDKQQEFDIFALAFNEMLDSIDEKNKELTIAMSQLATAEKLSSLGSLVAGVSHELNTPIGVALTGSSSLGDRSEEIQKAMDDGSITKQQLNGFLDEVREGSQLIINNIGIASELIQNFKQVAVDQSSERHRNFNLKATIEEVLTTLGPTLKKTQHTVQLDIPDNIMMQSYPGPMGQVITNLVNNSVIHGFESIEQGKILISAHRDNADGYINLTYQDNGKGIPDELHHRIFEPFFTTRMGQGGSGLGMNIVHNIITGILEGTLNFQSGINQGVEFQMIIPVKTASNNEST